MCGCDEHIGYISLYKQLFLYYEYNYFKINTQLLHINLIIKNLISLNRFFK